MKEPAAFLVRLALFGSVAALAHWASTLTLDVLTDTTLIVGVVTIFPVVTLARYLLDRHPQADRAAWITTFLHAYLLLVDAVAVVRAWQTAADWRLVVLPVPQSVGTTLMAMAGIAATLVVINLALTGFGAPMVLWSSRRLAADWLYGYTRNPMVLASVLWLLTIGLWFNSLGFVLWVLLLVAPAEIFFIRVYEERELEIRFGQAYRDYRAKTPFLWPRWPKRQA